MRIYINQNEEKFLKYFLLIYKIELLRHKHNRGELNYVQFKELLAINSLLEKLKESKIYALF